MRLGLVALSAVLLSGCSWMGGAKPYTNPFAKKAPAQYGASAGQAGPCQIYSPQQPVPQGCRPEQVTLATAPSQYNTPNMAGGFAQTPQFGNPQHTSGGYGSHAGQAHQMGGNVQRGPKLRKPKWRGQMSLGVEKSIQGDAIDYSKLTALDPFATYDPQVYIEGTTSGSPTDGQVTDTFWTANTRETTNIFTPNAYDEANNPNIAFDDAWSTPATISGGLEYIAGENTTIFGSAGYTVSEGEEITAGTISSTLYRQDRVQNYVTDPLTGLPVATGGPVVATSFIPNQEIARFSYDFSDMRRIDLDVGARHYFNAMGQSSGRTITPFVAASAGASHYNAANFKINQRQAFYQQTFEDPQPDGTESFYDVATNGTPVAIYDSQWVPRGQLNAGVEWQVTPKTALALETGLRIEGAREYVDGQKGDTNVAIPVTLRGSFNF